MAVTTKSLGPLHFEDLEPHRFEDLVRQLIYNFREWRMLEPTGRLGTDDGFDVRGWEVTDDEPENEDVDVPTIRTDPDRLWLIQCKREKSITPKKLRSYLDDVPISTDPPLHALLFVAACDFSKKTRDVIREWCSTKGLNEFYLWGRADIEDLLFRPENDHLLFAYFGVSLQIRKRSIKTQLQAILSIKRQAVRHFGSVNGFPSVQVLVRNPDEPAYPYKDKIKDFDKHSHWRVFRIDGHYHAGLKVHIRSHPAYYNPSTKEWDMDERMVLDPCYNDPWAKNTDREFESRVRHFWSQLPDVNRVSFEVTGHIPYKDILAIDENGDEHFPYPHIYVVFQPQFGPFTDGIWVGIKRSGIPQQFFHAPESKRIKFFPKKYPKPKKED